MTQQAFRIIVIGAGYAGLLATVRLAGKIKREIQNGKTTITLVNAADVFVERLRLHQFAANQSIPQRSIADTLRGTGVSFMRGMVTSIDIAYRTIDVQTETGAQQIGYDNLLYALGSTMDQESVPGVREHAFVLTPRGPNSAVALREELVKLNANREGGRLLVVGAGATGIEAAAEFAEAYRNLRVQLVTRGEFGKFMNKRIADYMRRSLNRLDVTIQDQTTITEVGTRKAITATGNVLPFNVCLWTGGFIAPRLARVSGLAVNERDQILIDPFMRSISHPEIYAVGDAAYPVEAPGVPAVRMSAVTAVMMGAHGADCLIAQLEHKTAQPFSFAYPGQGIALGRHNAIGFNNFPDDKPNLPYFTGKLDYEAREFFVRLLVALPNLERRMPGITVWLGKGRYAAAKRRSKTRPTSSLHPGPATGVR
jgi:NADH dehydrogenase FAD-containing subunit